MPASPVGINSQPARPVTSTRGAHHESEALLPHSRQAGFDPGELPDLPPGRVLPGGHPSAVRVIQYDPPKLRGKKAQAEALLETAIEAPDQVVTELVVELPIVEPAAGADRSIRPSGVNAGRDLPRILGPAKKTPSRFNR